MRLGKQADVSGFYSTTSLGGAMSREQRGRGLQMSEDHGADGVQGLRPGQETARKGPQEFQQETMRAGWGGPGLQRRRRERNLTGVLSHLKLPGPGRG